MIKLSNDQTIYQSNDLTIWQSNIFKVLTMVRSNGINYKTLACDVTCEVSPVTMRKKFKGCSF